MMANSMIGSLFAYGSYSPYIGAYLKSKDQNTEVSDSRIILPVWNLIMAATCIIGLKLSNKIGCKVTISLALGIFSIMQYLASFIPNARLFILIYGGICGACSGVAFLPSLYLAWSYFPRRKALVTGLVYAVGAGLSTATLAFLSEAIVNPESINDFEKNSDVIARAPYILRLQAFVFLSFTIFVMSVMPPMQLIKDPSELKADGQKDEDSETWVRSDQERILREFGTVYNEKNKIAGRDLANVSNLEDVISSPIKKLDSDGTTTKSMYLHKAEVSPFLLLKQADREYDDKYCNSATYNHGTPNTNKNVVEQEKSVPLLGNTTDYRDRNKEIDLSSYYLYSGSFILLILLIFCSTIFNFYLLNIWKDYFNMKVSTDVSNNTYIFVMGSVAAAVSSTLSGILLLKLHYKLMFAIFTILSVVVAASINFGLKSVDLGYAYLAAVFMSLAGQLVVFPVVIVASYPWHIAKQAYGYVFMATSFANIIQYGVSDVTDAYPTLTYSFGSLALVSLPFCLIFKPKSK